MHCSGPIDEINSSNLNILNLSSNGLSGSLPSSLRRCLTVDLSRNMISGDISIMQSWEATLEVLDLSILPSGLGAYSRLSAVDLSSNNLNGPIPSSFFTSTTLTSLNLSGNNFVGSIPFQGSHESELLVLPSYLPLDLSGELPNEISKLSDLEYLDLSSNNFRGEIPDKIPSSVKVFNVSHNDLSGHVPENLRRFPMTSFRPGNELLILPEGMPAENTIPGPIHDSGNHHSSKASIRVAIIVASVGAAVMIAFVLLAYYRAQLQDFHGRSGFSGQTSERDVKLGRFTRPSLFKFHTNDEPPATSLSFSNDHLLTSNSRSLSGQTEHVTEIIEHPLPGGASASSASTNPNVLDNHPTTSGRKSSPGSPLSSSPRFIEATEQHVRLDVYSPDRLAGELFFLDGSLAFTAEELSRAPAEVLGRSSHGTLYKATLDSGHMLTVKWLRVGLVKHKKEFAKEVKRIGSIRHPNVVPLRAYYWGPREQERLVLADYIQGIAWPCIFMVKA
ncbi:putative inactive receptor kinase [Vitis vinifera]|uniref:Putative inactive receptor kinase n=1 Tax=Vitis vinifera TaxID=29760 RepID=A0A438F4V7_VITVI|nr:putative inactive receptor kinase [Vitis vinifera]